VDIEETMDVKIAALKAHHSQMRDWDPEEMNRQWAAEAAKGKEMVYAEGYRVVTLVNDETWEKNHTKIGEEDQHSSKD
jgi:LmbE family N-acetylglucosaminyl deacetylase